jgi:hypothetical protein
MAGASQCHRLPLLEINEKSKNKLTWDHSPRVASIWLDTNLPLFQTYLPIGHNFYLGSLSTSRVPKRRLSTCSALKENFPTTTKNGQGKKVNQDPSKNIKLLVKQYGSLVWKTYWGVYFGALAGIFSGIQLGIMDPMVLMGKGAGQSTAEFAAAFMEARSWLAPYAHWVKNSPFFANFVLAWLMDEASEPLRIATTCALVPALARRTKYQKRS